MELEFYEKELKKLEKTSKSQKAIDMCEVMIKNSKHLLDENKKI